MKINPTPRRFFFWTCKILYM